MTKHAIIISFADHTRLRHLLNSARLDPRVSPEHLAALDIELARATVVAPDSVPRDVVTMYSTVHIRDLESNEEEHYTLVQPYEADVVRNRLSVLAPIGTALLGYRVGDIVQWKVPSGTTRLKIVEVFPPASELQGQPERESLADVTC
jgi:regulator of nucleoside diphosphate kinase